MRACDLAARLGQQADAVAAMLLPNGKRQGAEWCVGSIGGEPGDSLRVHLGGTKAGWWKDFAGDQGGDLIGLWMAVNRCDLREACRGAMEYLGLQDDRPVHVRRQYRRPDRDGVHRLSPEHAAWLRDVRKLPDETVAAYRLASRGDRLMFPYLRGDELVFAKYRKLPKTFSAEGDCEPILFGWQAVKPDARAVILAEGEMDALAWHAYGYPALSVPTGATGHAWLEGEYQALEPFDTIYLSFDADEAGEKGIGELVNRLGRERCRVVRLPCKDANDCLMQGIARDDMTRALRESRTQDPAELRSIGDFEDAIVAEINRTDSGLLLPWKKTHDLLKLRDGELSIWGGMNGHGKSQILSQIVAGLATHDVRCCVASMEWPTARWAYRMQRQIGAVEQPTEQYSRAITRALSRTLWTFNVAGKSKAERILEVFEYARRRYEIELFVIDNLTKCGFADDDYAGQKGFVEALADFARISRCHVALVAHMRKGDDESKPCGKMGVKGSGGITDMATTVVEVWRNKAREKASFDADGRPIEPSGDFAPAGPKGMDALMLVHKQNETGEEPTFRLWFNRTTGQFLAAPHHTPRSMLPLVGMATAGNAA